MRKIWSQRKDKERRRSQQPGSSLVSSSRTGTSFEKFGGSISTDDVLNEERSTAVASSNASVSSTSESYMDRKNSVSTLGGNTDNGSGAYDIKTGARMVSSLAKQEYDITTIKNGWLNCIMNTQRVNEISEQTLRVVRVELKGSHLYIYRPVPSLNVKSFRLDQPEPDYQETIASSTSELAGIPESQLTNDVVKYPINYFNSKIPHPDLGYDLNSKKFVGHSSIEAIVHFVLFDYDQEGTSNIEGVIEILPLFPHFDKLLSLWYDFLELIITKKIQGTTHMDLIYDRTLMLIDNISNNFAGFFLKSDVAPKILKIFELMTRHIFYEDSSRLDQVKTKMLSKQQFLVDLVSNKNFTSTFNPMSDLNSITFMNLNLTKLVSSVNFVDLTYFKNWNSNMDKSLLLASSLNDSSNAMDAFYKKNPLIFNNSIHLHYLSRLFIHQLFEEKGMASSYLEQKARLLEKWIDLGCLLDKSGNMSSWLGISSIILSQPILRLAKVWSLVSPEYIRLLKNDWSPVLFELDRRHLANESIGSNTGETPYHLNQNGDPEEISKDSYHIMAPRGLGKIYPKERVIPYFGDFHINDNSTNINDLRPIWKRINYSFSRWNEYLINLSNYNEIIKFNEDVLRRYDNMGFIFSNESLNQVLYLGVNNDDSKPVATSEAGEDFSTSNNTIDEAEERLRSRLLKLLEVNSNSINLEYIMKLSLAFEPDLPEGYLKLNEHNHYGWSLETNEKHIVSTSTLSSKSSESSFSGSNQHSESLGSRIADKFYETASIRVPEFNNELFLINLPHYDQLDDRESDQIINQKKNSIQVDANLSFKVDNFLVENDMTASNSMLNLIEDADHVIDDDLSGLGIDVDDILNSEKFNNITLSPDPNSSEKNEVPSKDGSRGDNNQNSLSSRSANAGITKQFHIPEHASVDRLVDLLLIDSKYFDESAKVDLVEYRFVFLLNYTSFLTTKDFLNMLAHRFINSGNAVISVMKRLASLREKSEYTQELPCWDLDQSVDLKSLGEVDYELLLKIQINILKVLIVLLNNFYSNFSLCLENKSILIKLLKLFSNEILQWYNSNKIIASLEGSFESLVSYYKKLKKLFVKKSYRPMESSKFNEYLVNEFRFTNSLHEVPMNRNLPGHKNTSKIEKFLYKFNKLLAVFYQGIKVEDWVKVFKVLEYHFEENTLFDFKLQRPNSNEDEWIVSNVFTYFESFVDVKQKQLVLKKFPLVFRKLFKLYYKFTCYLLIQLTDENITVEERLDRMKSLLIMAKLAALKMSDHQFVFEGVNSRVPSAIESAVINVIYSPESRMYADLWIQASNSLNGTSGFTFNDVDALLPRNITNNELISQEPLLPCFGWVIQNLMEINKSPSFYKQNINFGKRYLVYKFVKELAVEDEDNDELNFHESREFEFLLKLDETLIRNRHTKSHATSERLPQKIFKPILREQQRILVSDHKKKLMANARNENSNEKGAIDSGSGSKGSVSSSASKRQSFSYKSHSNSRFKISGIFAKSKQFSLNGLSSGMSERVVSSFELPNPETQVDSRQKPLAVLPFKSKKIFPVYILPNCFKVDSDSSNEDILFQSPTEADMNEWLVKLAYVNRHWFYSRTLNSKYGSPNITFGVPLGLVCSREQSLSPRFLNMILAEIEKEGLNEVGIYRISTSISELNSLRGIIDKSGMLNFQFKTYNVHALTNLVKTFFRELPDALLTDQVIEAFLSGKQNGILDGPNNQIDVYAEVLRLLPPVNYYTLKILMNHLNAICNHSEENRMTASNLSTVIGPALTEASTLDSLINNFGAMNTILEFLIENFNEVFEENKY